MARQINYGDDIFYLTFVVKRMRDAIRLDLDGDLFSDHLRDDVRFVDETIGRVHHTLIENPLMIRRAEYLTDLERLLREFASTLDEARSSKSTFCRSIPPTAGWWNELTDRQHQRIDVVHDELTARQNSPDNEHMVSEEELRYLFVTDDDGAA